MTDFSTLEEIEADLLFCEVVLNSRSEYQPAAQLNPSRRINSAGPVLECSKACGSSQVPGCLPAIQQEQQQSAEQYHTPQKQRIGSHAAPTSAAKARTTEELLAMLSSMPAGQPFEIDTNLLYSPQPSVAGRDVDHGSPIARSCSQDSLAWDKLLLQQRCGSGAASSSDTAHFSLPAHRSCTDGQLPLFSSINQAAAALSPLPSAGYLLTGAAASSRQLPEETDAAFPQLQQHTPGPLSTLHLEGLQQSGHGRHTNVRDSPPARLSACRSSTGSLSSLQQLHIEDKLPIGMSAVLQRKRQDRIAQLAQPRTKLWQQCARVRAQEEDAELQECTFKPQTGRPPNKQRVAPGVPVEERLQLAYASRQQALSRAVVDKEQEQLAECTFAPKLMTQPERHLRESYTPLHQRVGQEQKRRSTRMAQARLRRELGDAELTFQPQLNQRSLHMAAQQDERGALLTPWAAPRRAMGLRGSAGDAACTFSPAINVASERLLEDSATVPSDFHARLSYYSMQKELKQQAAAEMADSEACTFRPDTGNAVAVLALSSSHAGHLLESKQERYNRMGGGVESAQLAARRAAKQAAVYGPLQFTPQLNPKSQALAPAGSGGVAALSALAGRQRQKLAELQEAEQERQRSHCTFQPDTSKPRVKGYGDEYQPPQPRAAMSIAAAAKQGFEGLTERVADYQAQKEARAAAAKAEEQAKELAACSFAPNVNRGRVLAKGPVVVRGLERYMELKQLQERQLAAAEERAAQVFKLHPKAQQGPTVQQPFRLAGHALLEARAAQKQSALLVSTLKERMDTCTFAPQTNHRRRQQDLQRMLE